MNKPAAALGGGRPEEGSPGERGLQGAVLVVEDEPTIADVVARYLQRAGYETEVVGDGARRSRRWAAAGRTS
jgi:PleD family two-component response regulator